ncbi:MAG: hypothetical protein EG823_06875 [Actinobacteria bacterium]|nr:hypothetical protein [Actinomycetota bacterium]
MSARVRNRLTALVAASMVAAVLPTASMPPASGVEAAGVTTGSLTSVTFTSDTTGFAAADNGVIMKTTDGGDVWTQVRGADTYSFRGIDFWNSATGVAVDHAGKVASTSDGGATWTNVDFTPYVSMDGGLLDATGRSHNDVACQVGGMAAITAAGDISPYDGTWTGGTSMGSAGNLRYWGNPFYETKPHRYLIIDQYYDVGRGELLDVEYAGSTIWACGIDYWTLDTANVEKYPLFKSTNSGVSYTKVTGFGTNDLRLEGVSFGSATAGITVGQVVGGNRVVYYTTDGGATWTASAATAGTAVLTAVDMTDAAKGWAASSDGTIVRTTDGGATWAACTITGGNPYALYDVEFRPGTTIGWAVGASGTVLLTTDGLTWRQATGGPQNTAPVLAAIGNKNVAEGSLLSFTATATDADIPAQTLIFSLSGTPPTGAAITSGGSFTWTPTEAQGPGTYPITVVVSDGAATASETITVTVSEVHTAPVLAAIGNKNVAEGSLLSFTATATDADIPAQTLIFSLSGTPPTGAAITSGGSFTWTPTEAQGPGTYPITVVVSDGAATASETITVTVSGGSTPPPPPVPVPVYRFYNFTNNTHFYTDSAAERANVNATWPHIFQDEGVAYYLNPANNTTPLTRLYNRVSSSHFYTASAGEAANALARWPGTFSMDGPTYAVNPGPVANSVPVYRFYNKSNGSHFYTASEAERNNVLARWPNIYSLDGPAFWLGQ